LPPDFGCKKSVAVGDVSTFPRSLMYFHSSTDNETNEHIDSIYVAAHHTAKVRGPFEIKSLDLSEVPKSGVYILLVRKLRFPLPRGKSNVLYIGKSVNMRAPS